MSGKLYIVPTPIGNLEDITLRALRVLKEVDLILAEDTRTSGILLKHYDINKPLQSHHIHNEHIMTRSIVQRIGNGLIAALISDAGTPSISDPGFLLVRACIEEGLEVECLPGPVSFIPALVVSGLPTERFHFEGFLPLKKGRKKRLEQLAALEYTVVFFESPYRIAKTLKELVNIFGSERRISISRELTKLYEETLRGKIGEIAEIVEQKKMKGEFVVVIEGASKK